MKKDQAKERVAWLTVLPEANATWGPYFTLHYPKPHLRKTEKYCLHWRGQSLTRISYLCNIYSQHHKIKDIFWWVNIMYYGLICLKQYRSCDGTHLSSSIWEAEAGIVLWIYGYPCLTESSRSPRTTYWKPVSKQNKHKGLEGLEKTQQLRSLATVPEDLGSIPTPT